MHREIHLKLDSDLGRSLSSGVIRHKTQGSLFSYGDRDIQSTKIEDIIGRNDRGPRDTEVDFQQKTPS